MITLLAAAALAAASLQGQQPRAPQTEGGYSFQLHLPPGASAAEANSYPLMIFLHGSGERGSNLDQVKVHGPPKIADRDRGFPFVLISPQLPADEDWDIAKLGKILDWALESLPVDPERVILTGMSRGGHATWRWAAAEPGRFAAIAPVAGRGDPAAACPLKSMPLWAFHGDRDDVVPPEGSFAMARAIRACGGNPRLTIYPDFGHNSWDPAYADPALYLWLLQQRRPASNKDNK